jgi:hypothetical protein
MTNLKLQMKNDVDRGKTGQLMSKDYYQYDPITRRRLFADAGFICDDLHIWSHADGRAIGDGVASALTDEAFFRFLRIDPPETESYQPPSTPGSDTE